MRYFILVLTLLVTACASYSPNIPSVRPYKLDIQQGNVITPKMMLQLRPGMTRTQVRFVMGTPLLTDSFHADRWDYFYQMNKDGKVIEQRRVILEFEGDFLQHVRGDVIPSGKGDDSMTVVPITEPKGEWQIKDKPGRKDEKGFLDKLKFWESDDKAKPATEAKPAPAPEVKPAEAKPAEPKSAEPAPAPKAEMKPEPAVEPAPAPESATETKVAPVPAPAAEPEAQPEPAVKPAATPEPEAAPEPAPSSKVEAVPQPEPVAEPKAAPQPEPVVEPKVDAAPLPVIEPEKTEPAPEAIPETKPEPKAPEVKVPPKQEKGLLDKLKFWEDDDTPKAEVKPEVKPEAKPEMKAEPKPVPKAEPAPIPQAEPKPAPPVEKAAPQPKDLPEEDAPDYFEKMLEKIGF